MRREQCWSYCEPRDVEHHGLGTVVLGVGVLALGVILTLHKLGVFDAGAIAPWWPLLMVLLGVSYLVRPTATRCVGVGLVWIGIGTLLLLSNLGLIGFAVWGLWPLALVFVGFRLLTRRSRCGLGRRRGRDGTAAAEPPAGV
jgi:hypothetical protein